MGKAVFQAARDPSRDALSSTFLIKGITVAQDGGLRLEPQKTLHVVKMNVDIRPSVTVGEALQTIFLCQTFPIPV